MAPAESGLRLLKQQEERADNKPLKLYARRHVGGPALCWSPATQTLDAATACTRQAHFGI